MSQQHRTLGAQGTNPAHRRKRLTAAQRRERFLDVACELIVDAGLSAVTMERVARQSGVSRALAYGYFDNSDELLAAVFEREVGAIDQLIFARLDHIRDPRERLKVVIEAVTEVFQGKGVLLGRLFQSHHHGEALEAARNRRANFVEDFFAQQMQKDLDIPIAEARIAASIWQTAFVGALSLCYSGKAPTAEVLAVYTRMADAGVRALIPDSGLRESHP